MSSQTKVESKSLNDFDFNSFTTERNDCTGKDKDLDEISKCDYSYRLLAALRYYSLLNISNKNSQNGIDIFAQLCEDNYTNLLNDWIHFITTHSNHIDTIHNQLIIKHNFPQCTIDKCQLVVRHYRNDRRNAKNIKIEPIKDAKCIFYRDIMDAMHQFLFHLYDLGLRLKSNIFEENEMDESKEANDEYNCYDYKFAKIKKIIETKHKKLGAVMDRFTAENNKFNIGMGSSDVMAQQNDNAKEGEDTFMNALFDYLMQNKGNINEIKVFKQFLDDEEFDSDAIQYEIQCLNILKEMKSIRDLFKKFIINFRLSSSSFSTGLIFYYWHWYAPDTVNINEINKDPENYNDHSGIDIKHLYVQKKYNAFKEEILSHITINEYNDLVMTKVQQYISTKKVKKTYAKSPSDDHLHYGIKRGEKLSQWNLISLILYCDFSSYCTEFTASFRAATPYEALGHIRERHRQFWWMGKTLRETVQYYGNGVRDNIEVNGIFYCGMSIVMEIPQFFIRLCSPTSTSVQIQIAANFAKRTGMIIELSNHDGYARRLRMCDCSWISRFVEEDERLFIGGDYPIRIKSIRIIYIHQNFELFFGAMYMFNCMVNGIWTGHGEIKPTKTEKKIIKTLLDFKLGVIASTPFDKYIENTFTLFCNIQNHILISLHRLHNDFKSLKHLIVSETVRSNEENESQNLCKPLIFKLFENASHITIYATDSMWGFQYRFSLISLLNVINTSLTWTKITIKGAWDDDVCPWFSTLWLSNSEALTANYKENNYLISLHQKYMENSDEVMEDCLIISRK
eukprot:172714_1